ncbi:MAG TPA: potassium-transporting ATPase subunit KdpA [Streptosporangiaceae bacterium]|jgi:K+-transporting ATPase ATPase A chain|nr:potassium-transporting ATPase subunit KdpA [Streptosporangiaceae bacterium]
MAGWLQALLVLGLVGVLHVPLGNYMARAFTTSRHWRLETAIYRACGIDPASDQRWSHYAVSVLAVSGAGVLLLYLLLRIQAVLPYSLGHPGMNPALAFNTAVSFTTNTSWQNYSGEATLGFVAQAAGLGTEAFLSAAVGLCVALALIRGLVRRQTDRVGNFWVDLVRSVTRVLLPLAAVFAVVLAGLGVVQNLSGWHVVSTLAGARQAIPGGPVASWESIKLMSGDGGGFFNANSAHPFENPAPLTNVIEITLMLLIPFAVIRMYGRMVGDRRQGWALLVIAGVLLAGWVALTSGAELSHAGAAPTAAGAAMEGKETAFGVPGSALFGAAATSSADGAANASYDSFTALGGGLLMSAMMLGEISPGGVGSGLYGLVMVVLIAVFLGGLMISRTPEYLRKRIRASEMRMVALYYLATPVALLAAAGLAIALPAGRAAISNSGPHGLSEIVYAFTSAANSNGSAFGGLSGNTTFYNVLLAIVMLAGRYAPMILVLGLAGSLARQKPVAVTPASLRTHGPMFVTLSLGVALVLVFLTFLPALSLGPLAEGLR